MARSSDSSGRRDNDTPHKTNQPWNLQSVYLRNLHIDNELRKIQSGKIILNTRGGQKGHPKVRHDDGYDAMYTALCTLALGQYDAHRGANVMSRRPCFSRLLFLACIRA